MVVVEERVADRVGGCFSVAKICDRGGEPQKSHAVIVFCSPSQDSSFTPRLFDSQPMHLTSLEDR